MANEAHRPAARGIADLFSMPRRPSNVIALDSVAGCRAATRRDLVKARSTSRQRGAAGAACGVTAGWLEARCLNCRKCPEMPL